MTVNDKLRDYVENEMPMGLSEKIEGVNEMHLKDLELCRETYFVDLDGSMSESVQNHLEVDSRYADEAVINHSMDAIFSDMHLMSDDYLVEPLDFSNAKKTIHIGAAGRECKASPVLGDIDSVDVSYDGHWKLVLKGEEGSIVHVYHPDLQLQKEKVWDTRQTKAERLRGVFLFDDKSKSDYEPTL